MKILWLCNTPLPSIAKRFGKNNYNEGWIVGMSNRLKQSSFVELTIIFPQNHTTRLIKGKSEQIQYYGFYKLDFNRYDSSQRHISEMQHIISCTNPDIIHIWGTEYPHCLEMIEAAQNKYKIVISIQGLTSVCAKHYLDGIPVCEIYRPVIWNGHIQTILSEKKAFTQRSKIELEAIKLSNYFIGRTDYDKACIKIFNENSNYFYCGESLRDTFYNEKWNIEKVQRFSIFITQCSYPIKGFHFMLKALVILKKRFPKIHVYVAGMSEHIIGHEKTAYGQYLYRLINNFDLKKHITFLGYLPEKEICLQFLRAHATVVCSTIENSSNSIGEAMLLGVPIVSSFVGGTGNLLQHGKEGFLYQHNAPYMLAFYLEQLFKSDKLANKISNAARERANALYNREKNNNELLRIYQDIAQKHRRIMNE